ncbi:MAG: DUF475 domain-containing protein [Paracoccaceae bacterium]|nr:DUF475 domain-containing protein [Paracoccaceae bacterium]
MWDKGHALPRRTAFALQDGEGVPTSCTATVADVAAPGLRFGEDVRTTFEYFRGALGVTLLGLVAAFVLGLVQGGNFDDGISFLVVCLALTVLEISLSFDNAVVNANTLQGMSPLWQRRFLTWGIVVAVFGMRLLFPLLIVAIAADLGPLDALHMAMFHPDRYAEVISHAHLQIAAFGGTFLMMVALHYFIDEAKDVDWIARIECKLRACAAAQGLEVAFVLVVILGFAAMLPADKVDGYMMAAIAGLLSYSLVRGVGRMLDGGGGARRALAVGGLGAFLYLELLDASFSFDGVVGAFAMTDNLFLIAIGLGIGAVYVRSMTVMLVEKGTLSQFRYLEHGAFYSIMVLSFIMFVETQIEVSEMATGAVGVVLIAAALWSSVRHNRRLAEKERA